MEPISMKSRSKKKTSYPPPPWVKEVVKAFNKRERLSSSEIGDIAGFLGSDAVWAFRRYYDLRIVGTLSNGKTRVNVYEITQDPDWHGIFTII